MPYVDGYGVADCGSIPKAQGALLHGARASGGGAAAAYLLGNLDHGASGLSETLFVCLAKLVNLVKIASAVATESEKIRITFNRSMLNDLALKTKGNYRVTPITAGAAQVVVNSVEPEAGVIKPSYVDLITSEMTDGAEYLVWVSPTGPTDPDGTTLDPAGNEVTITGLGEFPAVANVIAVSANRIDVVFSEKMKDNADIRNVAKYAFDNGLEVLNVLDVVDDTVQLVTTDQAPGLLYTLTVTP